MEKTDIEPRCLKRTKRKEKKKTWEVTTTVKLGRCHQLIDLISLANHSLKCISKFLTSNLVPKIAVASDQHIPGPLYYYYHGLKMSER